MLYRLASVLLALFCVSGVARADDGPKPALKLPLATEVTFLGLASAGDRVVAVGERGVIVYSDDGSQWVQADVPTRATLTAVTFVTADTGYAVGHDAVILKSEDAGASWALLNFEPDSQNVMLNVRFRDARRGYVVGSNGQLWHTADAGANWQRTTLSVEDWYQNHIFGVTWTPSGSVLAVAEKGVLYRSVDGVAPFESIESPYDGSFFGVLALPDGRPLVYGMNGHAFVSDDGVAWQQVDTGTQQFLFDAALLPDGGTLLVGGGGTLVRLAQTTLEATVRQLAERAGITAVLPVGDAVYLATEAGGVQRKLLDELLD